MTIRTNTAYFPTVQIYRPTNVSIVAVLWFISWISYTYVHKLNLPKKQKLHFHTIATHVILTYKQ